MKSIIKHTLTRYLFYAFFILMIAGCDLFFGYRIDQDFRGNRETGEREHITSLWHDGGFVYSWRIPGDSVTCDAIKNNRMKADSLIRVLKKCQ